MSEFKNVHPKGRENRLQRLDRHTYEKNMLANRKEGFQRHDATLNPLHVPENSLGFVKEADRFHKDVATEEKVRRDNTLNRKQHVLSNIRDNRIKRETDRWEQYEKKYEKEESRLENKRKADITRKNNSRVEYDLITLRPTNQATAALDKFKQDSSHYRGAVRCERLFIKDSRGYNPITGEPKPCPVVIPPKPTLPQTKSG